MVLICVADEALAKAIGVTVRARRLYASTVEHALDLVRDELPSTILIDVRLGGSKVRAIEVVPWMLKASPLSAIVVLTRSPSVEELEEISAMGVYGFVDLASGEYGDKIRSLVSSARRSTEKRASWAQRRRAGASH